MKLKFTKDFYSNLEKILSNNKAFSSKIEKIILDFENYGLGIENFSYYDLRKLNHSFYRLKIIPYRIIIKKYGDFLVFDNIFKRKGKSDYKKYSK